MGFGGPASAGKGSQGHANGPEPMTGVMKVHCQIMLAVFLPKLVLTTPLAAMSGLVCGQGLRCPDSKLSLDFSGPLMKDPCSCLAHSHAGLARFHNTGQWDGRCVRRQQRHSGRHGPS